MLFCDGAVKTGCRHLTLHNDLRDIMICNLASYMEAVSFLNLETLHIRFRLFPKLPHDLDAVRPIFEVRHSASWRKLYPGDTRMTPDLASFYDTTPSSLVLRRVSSAVELSSDRNIVGGHEMCYPKSLTLPSSNVKNSWATRFSALHMAFIAAYRTTFFEHLLLQAGNVIRYRVLLSATKCYVALRSTIQPADVTTRIRPRTHPHWWMEGRFGRVDILVRPERVGVCTPASGVQEMCYLPAWRVEFFLPPEVVDLRTTPHHFKPGIVRPQPKCIRRLEVVIATSLWS
ncbi:hypothetical protein BDR04DRAFT_1113125 [Suillus decipiens]|nr:hypothetical protein BDR04DRAFT_1113125 [Suillus decipiens]